MLQFEEIKDESMENMDYVEDNEVKIPKSFILTYTDDELNEKFIPEMWEKLNEHKFDGDVENIDFIIYFDDLNKKSKIIVALYYSEDDSSVLEINKIAKHNCPLFEEFYNKNKPY